MNKEISTRPSFRVGPDSSPDRYVLGPVVGSGSEGILYRGSITTGGGLDLDVAIKMLQPRLLDHVDEWHERWSDQIELLRSLQVPGVVAVRDGFLGALPHHPDEVGEGRTLYLVMNWVDGQSLEDWVRHHPERDPIDDLRKLLPVAAALDLMHSGRPTRGVPVVHGDVKPSNILVTDEGTVLVDFGLTRGLPTGHRLSDVIGTAGYLAPECVEQGLYSPATDRYALGAVAYFVMTGTEPPADHDPTVMGQQLDTVPPLSGRPELIGRIMEMLDAEPGRRPTALANWIGQLRQSSLVELPYELAPMARTRNPQTPPSRSRSPRRRRQRVSLAVAAAVVLVAAGVLVGYIVGHDGHHRSVLLPTLAETPGSVVHTWSDYRTAEGRAGPLIPSNQTVLVSCKVAGYKVTDGDVWWYRIQSSPWGGKFYGSADAFYNNGSTSGPLRGTPLADPKVPDC